MIAQARVVGASIARTITMTGDGDHGGALAIAAEAFRRSLPVAGEVAEVEAPLSRTWPGTELGFDDLTNSAQLAAEARSGHNGVVMTHDTRAIEKSAFALDLAVGMSGAPSRDRGVERHVRRTGAEAWP